MLEMLRPFMDTVPEVSEEKQMVTGLSGSIELNHISFRYKEKEPLQYCRDCTMADDGRCLESRGDLRDC